MMWMGGFTIDASGAEVRVAVDGARQLDAQLDRRTATPAALQILLTTCVTPSTRATRRSMSLRL